MVGLGVILLIVGLVFHVYWLWVSGIVLVVIGGVLWALGTLGRPIAGRRHWY